jgi:hypothetical protein
LRGRRLRSERGRQAQDHSSADDCGVPREQQMSHEISMGKVGIGRAAARENGLFAPCSQGRNNVDAPAFAIS